MGTEMKFHWKNPAFIVDVVQATIAIVAAIVLALDTTGVINLPWIKDNLLELSFIAICLLLVSSFLERRFTLESYKEETNKELENLSKQIEKLENTASGIVSVDHFLRSRVNFDIPMDSCLAEVEKEFCATGISLYSFMARYGSLIAKQANLRNCKYRFIINSTMTSDDREGKDEKKNAIKIFQNCQKEAPGKIELRLLDEPIYCSIAMFDGKEEHGRITVEFYIFTVKGKIDTSERPHIDLLPHRDPIWYKFYQNQFEEMWEKAIPITQS